MLEPEQICPYTGLRSFTEEESLYFKGREEDIDQATAQLQRNKFLMLTGASGDGKSSLIYAGIIPNARAGFLKSKYTQWCVADFRPERTPFHNLCKAIAKQLDIKNHFSVQAELNHGFSAIADLYRNSKRYIDPNSIAWQQADEKGKAALKRQAANLVILVDQFEEFFTNPENYHKGVPSGDANLVLNLLLETARIALEEDLPIYIVFTMRSDYIGQCAAFRGLPEYIGFSQFFVPRLNRTQLQQVIEEPAVLSGNRITRRLTERLILDLTEGVDQLPILQHALNQVWHAADNGKEEMDLLHYAMVGGMPVGELPDEQLERFNKWFDSLPPEIKACYHKPDLQNVLDTHTNKLYEQAEDYYQRKTGKTISDADAKEIIKTAFTCLTKIDESRAVRNRMTLGEITDIIGKPGFGTREVGDVLDIFREPGNTFIRPFITDDPESQELHTTDILDITHESLIRNWEYLEQWAKLEYDNYLISLDFEQQLNRWVASDKSNDFLLSIGPLTYFENWFNTTRPNAYWIARYLPDDIEQDKKLAKAELVLSNGREFLKRSAAKHRVTRTIMRYGPKRIAGVLGLVAVITLSSFAVRDYFRKQNDFVLKSFKEKAFDLVNIPRLSPEYPVPVVTGQLMLGNLTVKEVIDAIRDPRQKIKIANGIATQLITQGRNEPRNEIYQSLSSADSLLENLAIPQNSRELSDHLRMLHDFTVTSGIAYLFNQEAPYDSLVKRHAKRSARLALHILKTQPNGFSDIQGLSLNLENGINYAAFSRDEINQLLKILSPFEGRVSTPWLEKNYSRDNIIQRGGSNYGPRFNGLYQDLAYLYAATGNTQGVIKCLDSLLRYQENFYQNDYATHVDNASNIAAVYYAYGTTDQMDEFVKEYCSRKNVTTAEFYNRLVTWALIDDYFNSNANFYAGGGGREFANLNIKFGSDEMIKFYFRKLEEEVAKIPDVNERNFNLATALKNKGVLLASRQKYRSKDESVSDQNYKEAINVYRQLPEFYLNQPVPVVTTGSEITMMPRKILFLYPDYRVAFHPNEPRNVPVFYNSESFINYVLEQNLFDSLYRENDEFRYFEFWFSDYQIGMSSRDLFYKEPMDYSFMQKLAAKLEERNANRYADLNNLYLHLGEQAFIRNDSTKGISFLGRVQPEKLLNSFQYKNYNFVNSYSFELVGKAIANLTVHNQFAEAYRFLNVFKKEVNRSSLYGYASQLVSLKRQPAEIAQRLLDSARAEQDRLHNSTEFQPNRHQVAIALMYQDPGKNSDEAYRVIKNSPDKFGAIIRFAQAYAFHGSLYKAQKEFPPMISSGDRSFFLQATIEGFNSNNALKKEWTRFQNNKLLFARRYLPYISEN
jgi:hypothetical protein